MTQPEQLMTRSEFAEHTSMSRSYVTKLANTGRLVLSDDGRVRVQATLALLKETTGAPERAADAVVGEQYTDWRERKERAQAEMAEMDVAQRRGTLMEADRVRSAAVAAVTALRSRLELLPDQLAPQLAATTDEQRVRAHLASEIEAALAELAQQIATHLMPHAGGASH